MSLRLYLFTASCLAACKAFGFEGSAEFHFVHGKADHKSVNYFSFSQLDNGAEDELFETDNGSWAYSCATAEKKAGVESGDRGGGVVMKLVMGTEIDYVRAAEGHTFCEMLFAFNKHELMRNIGDPWETVSFYHNHNGGSVTGFGLSASGRNYAPQFWGYNTGFIGTGCCVNGDLSAPAWGRAYDIYIVKV